MQDFNYHRPTSLADAVKLLKDHPDAKLLSGGMTIIPTMKQRLASPSDVIDLGAVGLSGISVEGDTLTVQAGTTHAEVATNDAVRKAIPALADLAARIGDPHVRNRGTIGGSVANNDPAADYPAALVACKATVITNQREVAAEEFFTGMFETALGDDEIITAVKFEVPKRAAYAKFPNPASRYAMVGVFVADFGGDVRVAVTGAGDRVFRVGHGAGAGRRLPAGGGGRPHGPGRALPQRHARLGRVSRPSGQRHGQARRHRGGEEVAGGDNSY
jgi:aerobic carbon-monoxide dehydrogenase medium subunit